MKCQNSRASLTITAWLDQRIEAIDMCTSAGFAEEALALLYSAIDTLAFLSAPAGVQYVNGLHFADWCDRYIVPGLSLTATGTDLYGARCGVLHTSSAASRLGRAGTAREVWYRFNGLDLFNLMTNTPKLALLLDLTSLVGVFRSGGQHFATDLNNDCERMALAQKRAAQFFTRGRSVS